MCIEIFGRVVLPLVVLVALGVLVQRHTGLQMATLSRLNIYLFVPAFIFLRIYDSRLTFGEIGWLCLVATAAIVMLGAAVAAVLRWRGVSGAVAGPVLLAAVLYNAGNFGIPVAELLYVPGAAPLFRGMADHAEGPQVQGILVMLSNFLLWGVGYLVLACTHGDWRRGVVGYLKLPMLYAIVAAFVVRAVRQGAFAGVDPLPVWLRYPLEQLAAGTVPVALVTLGAQLGMPPRGPRDWPTVLPTVALKLLALPVVTAALVLATNGLPWPALHLWPWPGAQLIIAAAGPTAVNTLLLSIEAKGNAELAGRCVFWSTILSALTVTLTIVALLAWGA